MRNKQYLDVVIFAGGRGCRSIIQPFIKYSQINLTIIVNAYDDGLSTGLARRLMPGMLGPSDIRKNISNISEITNPNIVPILEYRLPKNFSFEQGNIFLKEMACNLNFPSLNDLNNYFLNISFGDAILIKKLLNSLNNFIEINKVEKINLSDFSFGNLLFCGAYALENFSFNLAIEKLSALTHSQHSIMNVTDGRNLVLNALKEDGTIFFNEAGIVATQNNSKVSDIYLFDNYLSDDVQSEMIYLPYEEKKKYLSNNSIFPNINPNIKDKVKNADLIIYGPGTQHSSLFPSYLTKGLGTLIESNISAEKIYISNICKDHEISSESLSSLIEKFHYYLNLKGTLSISKNSLVSKYFINSEKCFDINYLKNDLNKLIGEKNNFVVYDWESSSGSHYGNQVLAEIINIVNSKIQNKLKSFSSKVSIIVPVYNEESTIVKVIKNLRELDFYPEGLDKEIIIVDGMSDDSSYELISAESGIKSFRCFSKGKGECLKLGLANASGDIIVFFPSDGEYNENDIRILIRGMLDNETNIIFGSRNIKFSYDNLRSIYGKNYLYYLISKFGGFVITIVLLVLYNRFVGDPLTSIKIFKKDVLKNIRLTKKSFDLETEIIAKLSRSGEYFLELPVSYKARTKKQGKKMNLISGLFCLFCLIQLNFKI